ncbi:MAG: cytochrome c [Bacteroidota bacterium]
MTKCAWACVLFVIIFGYIACQENPYRQGKNLYTAYCATCHMEEGQGLKGLFPPIAGADYLEEHFEELPCIIRYGLEGEIVVNGRSYNQPMLAIKNINEIEIANIMNFINREWRNVDDFVSPEQVRQQLSKCQ